jgi:hypothetical protein
MPTSVPTPISDDQITRVVEALRGHWSDFGWLMEAVGADSIAQMSSVQAVKAMSLLQQKRRQNA